MELNIRENGKLEFNDCRIIFRNFSGVGSKFNREGDKNFAIVIPDTDCADMLANAGWNVKMKPALDEGDMPRMNLPVKVKFNDHGPNVYLQTGATRIKLTEENVGMLDKLDVERIDCDIRPYDWEVNGNKGRSAYLDAMLFVQRCDRFAADMSVQ